MNGRLWRAFWVVLAATAAAERVSVSSALGHLRAYKVEPRLSEREQVALAGYFCREETHLLLEFGSGGSTLLAALCGVDVIHSVDSSLDWLKTVKDHEILQLSKTRLFQYHADIGELGEWGHPLASFHRGFAAYSQPAVFLREPVDVVFVDGRFRVACALRSLSHMHANSVLIVHDYPDREAYHPLEVFFKLLNCVDTLCVFERAPLVNLADLSAAIKKHTLLVA